MPDTMRLDYAPAAQRFGGRIRDYSTRLATRSRQVVRDQMEAVRASIVATTPVDTGALRESWSPVTQGRDALTWRVSTDLPYAPVLEYGGYPGVGPKTVALGGGTIGAGFLGEAGIYSRQAPLGWVRRALAHAAPGFLQAIGRAVTQTWAPGGDRPSRSPSEMTTIFGVPIVEQPEEKV